MSFQAGTKEMSFLEAPQPTESGWRVGRAHFLVEGTLNGV